MQLRLSDEAAAKVKAKREERATRAEARTQATQEAWEKALASVDYDETRLIVYPMPEAFGGGTIHRLPTSAAWATCSRSITRALVSDGKKADQAVAIAGLIENASLLVHPPLGELQAWREELPDLYQEIHSALDARCSYGQVTGK
jgi:hypothetical protein